MKTPIKISTALLTSGILLSTLLTACDSADTTDKVTSEATEAAVNKMTDSDMDISIDNDDKQAQTIVMKGDGDEEIKIAVGNDVSLPEDFPSDVPLPDGMKLISTANIPKGFVIHGAVAGDLTAMINQTKKEAKDAGWEELMVSKQEQTTTIMVKKEDRIVNYSVMELEPKDRQIESHNLMYSVIAS
ncbi:hypothetical protein ACS8E3_09100 [Psychrobacter sp. 2Y5]|uniref:hypothetical protein n=1 Tax=unclassified Psychrobacter TaxID=196806 RepID=UPI003F454284